MRDLLARHPSVVAPLLLNARLTSTIGGERVVVRLTEVEAYGGVGEDPGSHAFRRQTPRNATMFESPGHAYVYFTYGMHWCLNVVAHQPGWAGAVLLRGAEVVTGIDVAQGRRGPRVPVRDMARGPARLTVALAVTGEQDGVDLFSTRSPLRLSLADPGPDPVVTARTGVGGAGAPTAWRFHLPDEPTVSPYRAAQARRR
jgi:DNA-3-methyladenine glycosylase